MYLCSTLFTRIYDYFVVKEKVKLLKKDIKEWILEKFGGNQANGTKLVTDINNLDMGVKRIIFRGGVWEGGYVERILEEY